MDEEKQHQTKRLADQHKVEIQALNDSMSNERDQHNKKLYSLRQSYEQQIVELTLLAESREEELIQNHTNEAKELQSAIEAARTKQKDQADRMEDLLHSLDQYESVACVA